MDNYLEEIKKILKTKGVNKPISYSTNLNELGLDSLDLMDCVVEAEERFRISIKDDEITKIKSVKDFISVIEKEKN